jgi:hypothetical protein
MKIREMAAAFLVLAGLALAGLVANASAGLRGADHAFIYAVTHAYATAGAGVEARISISYE